MSSFVAFQHIDPRYLKFSEYNPRLITDKEAKELKESISKFGCVDPLIINAYPGRENVVIGGNQRLKIALELGITEVPIVLVHLDEAQEHELNIRLNKNVAGWDWEKLADFDISLLKEIGFDSKDLDHIFKKQNQEENFDAENELAAISEPESRPGEIYELGRHRLLCGDSTKEDDVKKLMDGKLADLVFTDPPYNVDWDYRGKFKERGLEPIFNDNLSDDEWNNFVDKFVTNMVAVMKPGAPYYMCSGWHSLSMFEKHLALKNAKVRQLIIWAKNQFVMGKQATDYHRQHEQIWYGWKEGAPHKWYGGRKESDLWEIDKVHNLAMIHSTEKPVDLPAKAIANSSQRGDLVLDLFSGSGSTLIACEQLDRTCYISELDQKYCDVIRKRYNQYVQQAGN